MEAPFPNNISAHSGKRIVKESRLIGMELFDKRCGTNNVIKEIKEVCLTSEMANPRYARQLYFIFDRKSLSSNNHATLISTALDSWNIREIINY